MCECKRPWICLSVMSLILLFRERGRWLLTRCWRRARPHVCTWEPTSRPRGTSTRATRGRTG